MSRKLPRSIWTKMVSARKLSGPRLASRRAQVVYKTASSASRRNNPRNIRWLW
jgi:hypothetical protein